MMMTSSGGGLTSARTMRNSPFRESEWDRRLDHLLQDLENSTSSASAGQDALAAAETAAASSTVHQQSSAVVQAAYTSTAASSSNNKSQQLQVAQQGRCVSTDRAASELSQQSGYAQLSKSRSTNSLGQGAVVADNMLKDLDQALKASTNYIESHRTVQLPNGTQEIHEYRSTSSSGTPRNVAAGDFNLERQVQHMMPSNLSVANGHGLQSANMVSSMQSSSQTTKSSYTSYKVQSNSYTSGGATDRVEYSPAPAAAVDDNSGAGPERPGSRLKANIDELDTLLSDLNNAQRNSGGSTAAHHQSRHDNFVSSSEDYGEQNTMQGRVKTTVSSLNEYTTSGGTSEYRKPPSPSPKRRTPQPPATSVPIMSSPAMPPRRSSPSPSGRRGASPPTSHGLSAMSTANYSSTSYNYNGSRGSSPPRKRSPSPSMPSGGGQSYYSKYQQSSNYSSSNQRNLSPASFPTCPSPSPSRGPSVQAPPKKVDDLLTELSEFDPSIQHTTFQEPPPTHRVTTTTTKYTVDEDDFSANSRRGGRDPSPIKPVKKPAPASSTPGPAVYYPPGELFSSTRNDSADCGQPSAIITPANGNQQVEVSHTMEESSGSRGRAEMRAEYGYKSKSRYSETGDTKQGAAVVPICLPLCCAAPCVIL